MSVFDKHARPLSDETELEAHIAAVLAATAPGGVQLALIHGIVKKLFDPVVQGADNVPAEPCLFVGNHALLALDGLVLGPIFQRELGRFVRALGDRMLFADPRLACLLTRFGIALGHPRVCSALMAGGLDILVFPGGAREAVKPTRDLYRLQWQERYGFARLAAQHGYTIMPFAVVGPDEFYGHLLEGEDLPDSTVGQLLKCLGLLTDDTRRDILPPLPVGALGTPLPKPQRCYVGFGEPVNLSHLKGRTPSHRLQRQIRDQVAAQIEAQIAELIVARARGRGSEGLLRRLLTI